MDISKNFLSNAYAKFFKRVNGKDSSVIVPWQFQAIFDRAEKSVQEYFSKIDALPSKGNININDERYLLLRAPSMSVDFFESMLAIYSDLGEEASWKVAQELLFDISHIIGFNDAANFHKKMKVDDPITKLSTGPIHLAYTGWAKVEILPESKPVPNEDYFLKFNNPYSFEADSWIRANKVPKLPICIMNSGYATGWCEKSFGVSLTTVELECRALGHKNCSFIMASRSTIDKHLEKYHIQKPKQKPVHYMVPKLFNRKRIDDQLKKAQEFNEQILYTTSMGVSTYDVDGKCISANRALCLILDMSKEELLTINLFKSVLWNNQAFLDLAKKTLQTGEKNSIDLTLHTSDKEITLECHLTQFRVNEVAHLLLMANEITDKVKMNNKLFEAQKMDSIGALAGGIAHDFNNMLGGILGYATLLQSEEVDEEKMTYIDGILNAANRATELTSKLLAFGRKGKNLIQSIDLNKIVTEVLVILDRSMGKSVTIHTNFASDLNRIDADPSQIIQVIMNLCINASEAIKDTGDLTITTMNVHLDEYFCRYYKHLKPGPYVLIEVKDTGQGMSFEVRRNIFEPFFSTKKDGNVKGTGLGLSTVYGIVKNHCGIIYCTSEENKGSIFKTYFPKGIKPIAEEECSKASGQQTKRQGTILIIDDEMVIRDMARAMIKKLGFSVITAEGGSQGVEIFTKEYQKIDGVILDLQMPNMDGNKTFVALKQIYPKVRTIISTGHGADQAVQNLLDLGVKGALPKPYSIAELEKALDSYIYYQ
ncbi:MAG: response regulator [Bacteriovoracaceae bacterium]|nr:response regulator [Bacteriovoracaceae bacterium]